MPESEFVRHTACGACGSSDANALYTDGHTHCFACLATVSEGSTASAQPRRQHIGAAFITGEVQPLVKRCIAEETCRKFGYKVGTNAAGLTVQIAEYRNSDGELIAQKIRGANKTFSITGDGKDLPLFGQNLWPAKGRRVVITEGEIDALSVAEATGLSWPVVSLPNGAPAAKKALQRSLEWLLGYETIVLCFDMDEAGRAAANECAVLFPPGRCAIAELPRKDANEMLVAGEVRDLSRLLWNARTYRPDGIVSLDEIEERVLAVPETGRPYVFPGVTKATFGRRLGDVIGLGGGSGCGKTDWMTGQIAYDVVELGVPCGVLYLEQSVGETGRRIAGKLAGRRFHVPDRSWTEDELRATWGQLKATNRLHLYDSYGAMDWETIESKMRYMVSSLGCQHLFLDHLTALAAAEDDERKALEKIMAQAAGLAQALRCVLHYVSHLSTPEGRSHEEGGRVMARHFKGSRAIIYWSHSLWGLERNTQDPGSVTTLRCLKDRYTGNANGRTWGLSYDRATGLLSECELPNAAGFKDEEADDQF